MCGCLLDEYSPPVEGCANIAGVTRLETETMVRPVDRLRSRSAAGRLVDGDPDPAERVGERPAEDDQPDDREDARQGEHQPVLDESLAIASRSDPNDGRHASAPPRRRRGSGGAGRRAELAAVVEQLGGDADRRGPLLDLSPGGGGRTTIAALAAASAASRSPARRSSSIIASAGGRSLSPSARRRRDGVAPLGLDDGAPGADDARLQLLAPVERGPGRRRASRAR